MVRPHRQAEPEGRIHFHRIRHKTWKKQSIWRYLALLIIILFLLKFLRSF
ncbi:MAG: hypothetical protein KAU50_12545 [Candidatus Marinimicrobia bacterium]|nr:hypothetical protein [Candidatus Neomarinimicrobiota bacterium]